MKTLQISVRIALLLILPAAAFGQASVDELYIYNAVKGEKAYSYTTVHLDPPFYLVRDVKPSGARIGMHPNALDAPANAHQLFVWSSVKGDALFQYGPLWIEPPLAMYRDASGVHVTSDAGVAQQFDQGDGILMVQNAGRTKISVNKGNVAYRTAVPAGPGPCVFSADLPGSGVWAADAGHFYFCVPNADASGFVWARVALELSW